MENFDAINRYKWVYLSKIKETQENRLLLEVKQSISADFPVQEYIREVQSGAEDWVDQSKTFFTISFDRYVSYHVINESYAKPNPLTEYVAGDYSTFCIFPRSSYMNYILQETFADEIYPSELRHYCLFAANHVVQVISMYEPRIVKHT
jgi:hypothetical protein